MSFPIAWGASWKIIFQKDQLAEQKHIMKINHRVHSMTEILTGDFEIKKGYTVVGIASIFLVNLGNFKDNIR